MGGYESFFCKSAMPVVQSLRAQKGIKNLSEKKYEKTYRILMAAAMTVSLCAVIPSRESRAEKVTNITYILGRMIHLFCSAIRQNVVY